LAVFLGDDDHERCVVCIVKGFDEKSGLYSVVDQSTGALCEVAFEQLLYFNHTDKSFHVGDQVYALFRTKQQRGLSNEFVQARVNRVSNVSDSGGYTYVAHFSPIVFRASFMSPLMMAKMPRFSNTMNSSKFK